MGYAATSCQGTYLRGMVVFVKESDTAGLCLLTQHGDPRLQVADVLIGHEPEPFLIEGPRLIGEQVEAQFQRTQHVDPEAPAEF